MPSVVNIRAIAEDRTLRPRPLSSVAVDGIRLRIKSESEVSLPKLSEVRLPKVKGRGGRSVARKTLAVLIAISTAIGSASLLVSGFEAHVINVTAQIEGCKIFEVRSLGFWKTHDELWEQLLPQTLGEEFIDTVEEVESVFDASSSSMRNKLRKQLLALKFNIEYFGVGDALVPDESTRISELADEADELLKDPDASNEELEDMKDRVQSVNTAKKVSTCPGKPKDECPNGDNGHGWHWDHLPFFDFPFELQMQGDGTFVAVVNDSSTGGNPSAGSGQGGDGGDGGVIITGGACAEVEIENELNSNETDIDTCDGCGEGSDTIIVENDNSAVVENDASAVANTGGNSANGGDGGEGGDGGDAIESGDVVSESATTETTAQSSASSTEATSTPVSNEVDESQATTSPTSEPEVNEGGVSADATADASTDTAATSTPATDSAETQAQPPELTIPDNSTSDSGSEGAAES